MQNLVREFCLETSLHGFKYMAGSGSILSRLVWILTLITFFSASGYLVMSSLEEASKNPISSSYESLPVQELLFPSVSIDPGYTPGWIRFPEEVLNGLVFDCLKQGEECMQKRSEVEARLGDFTTDAVARGMLMSLHFLTILNDEKEFQGYSSGCGGPFEDVVTEAYLQDEMVGLVKAIKHRNFSEDDATTVLSQLGGATIRMPLDTTQKKIQQTILSLFSDEEDYTIEKYFEGGLGRRYYACQRLLQNLSTSMPSPLNMLVPAVASVALGDVTPLPLGELFTGFTTIPLYGLARKKKSLFEVYQDILGHFLQDHWTKADLLLQYIAGGKYYLQPPQQALAYRELAKAPVLEKHDLDFAQVLRVMKYGAQAPTSLVAEKADWEELNGSWSELNLPRVNASNVRHSHPRILACKFGSSMKLTADCPLFERSYSTLGLAFTFNAEKFSDVYKSTPRTDAFHQIINKRVEDLDQGPIFAENFGPASSLDLYLVHPDDGSLVEDSAHFRIVLHHPSDIPDLANQALVFTAGNVYTVIVNPSEVRTEADVMGIPLEKRKCHFPSEDQYLHLFKKYSQAGCLFECNLQHAYDTCECVPWDYPHVDNTSTICNSEGAVCFKGIMALPKSPTACGCLSACQTTDYPYNYFAQAFNPKKVCSDPVILSQMPHALIFLLSDDKLGLETRQRICLDWIRAVAVVRIYLGSSFYNRMTRSRRVTFTGQLSNLGGILSLFTGMSLLSVCEVAFWMGKVAAAGSASVYAANKVVKRLRKRRPMRMIVNT